MTSPTQRSLAELRKRGYRAQVVERWNSFARKRVDLFDCWDIVFTGSGHIGFCQCTSGSNVSSRVKKIADNDVTPLLRDAGVWLVIHGWRKNAKGKWTLRELDVS